MGDTGVSTPLGGSFNSTTLICVTLWWMNSPEYMDMTSKTQAYSSNLMAYFPLIRHGRIRSMLPPVKHGRKGAVAVTSSENHNW